MTTLLTVSGTHVMDAAMTPVNDKYTNYLVRVEYTDKTVTDFVVFGPSGMIKAELRNMIRQQTDSVAFTIVNAVSL